MRGERQIPMTPWSEDDDRAGDRAGATSSSLVRLTGLWKGKTRDGEPMLSGKVSPGAKLIILPNRRKAKDTEPDYFAFIAAAERPNGSGPRRGGAKPSKTTPSSKTTHPARAARREENDPDDIPF